MIDEKKPHVQWDGAGWTSFQEMQPRLGCAVDCPGCAKPADPPPAAPEDAPPTDSPSA